MNDSFSVVLSNGRRDCQFSILSDLFTIAHLIQFSAYEIYRLLDYRYAHAEYCEIVEKRDDLALYNAVRTPFFLAFGRSLIRFLRCTIRMNK